MTAAVRALRRESARIAAARPDVIKRLSDDEKETLLRHLAVMVNNGEAPALGIGVPSIVHRVAAETCTDPMLRFADLREALRERERFDDDPVGFAAERDLSLDSRAMDRLSERLDCDVAWALRTLIVGGA